MIRKLKLTASDDLIISPKEVSYLFWNLTVKMSLAQSLAEHLLCSRPKECLLCQECLLFQMGYFWHQMECLHGPMVWLHGQMEYSFLQVWHLLKCLPARVVWVSVQAAVDPEAGSVGVSKSFVSRSRLFPSRHRQKQPVPNRIVFDKDPQAVDKDRLKVWP